MKKNLVIFILVLWVLQACNVGTKTDLESGLTISHNGLSYDEGYLLMNNQKLKTKEYLDGKTVNLVLNNVEGFTLTDQKVYAGASSVVIDEKGNKYMEYPDLFEQFNQSGLSSKDIEDIRLNLTVAPPLELNTKYIWKARIWDKKGKGFIETETEFTILGKIN